MLYYPAFNEYRQYQQELALCQRYYSTSICAANDNGASANTKVYYVPVAFNTAMRVAPTVAFTSVVSSLVSSVVANYIYTTGFAYTVTASGSATMLAIYTSTNSAEL